MRNTNNGKAFTRPHRFAQGAANSKVSYKTCEVFMRDFNSFAAVGVERDGWEGITNSLHTMTWSFRKDLVGEPMLQDRAQHNNGGKIAK